MSNVLHLQYEFNHMYNSYIGLKCPELTDYIRRFHDLLCCILYAILYLVKSKNDLISIILPVESKYIMEYDLLCNHEA